MKSVRIFLYLSRFHAKPVDPDRKKPEYGKSSIYSIVFIALVRKVLEKWFWRIDLFEV